MSQPILVNPRTYDMLENEFGSLLGSVLRGEDVPVGMGFGVASRQQQKRAPGKPKRDRRKIKAGRKAARVNRSR